MNTRQTACFAATAMLLVAAAAAAPAAAAADLDTRTVQLNVQAAQLITPAGQAALRQRVAHAARIVCDTAEPHDFAATADMHACRQAAFLQAMSRVDIAIAEARARAVPQEMISSNLR